MQSFFMPTTKTDQTVHPAKMEADQNLHRVHMSEGTYFDIAAQIFYLSGAVEWSETHMCHC